MMGGETPETCWAVNKRQDNKLKNCCIKLVIYLNCTMMHGLTNLKFIILYFNFTCIRRFSYQRFCSIHNSILMGPCSPFLCNFIWVQFNHFTMITNRFQENSTVVIWRYGLSKQMNESTVGRNKSSCNNIVANGCIYKSQKQVKIVKARHFTIAVQRILGHPGK